MSDESDFLPYWTRHPHQLRAFAFVMLFLAPLFVPLIAAWVQRHDAIAGFKEVYRQLWAGLTHTMPAKPILRPAAAFFAWFLALLLPQAAIVFAFNYAAPHAPVWLLIVLYGGLVLFEIATRAHERKKARDAAGLIG
jgi:hypothetical protein